MAGLFDWQDPNQAASMAMAAGLLDAGGPQTRPVSFGQGLARGLLAGQGAYRAAEDQGFQRQLIAQRQKMLEDQAAEQQRAKEALAIKQNFLLNLPARMNMPGPGGPTLQNAALQGQVTPRLVAEAMLAGVDTKTLGEFANARNIGRPEVKHWADVRNPDGSVSVTGFNQYGDPHNTGATPFKAPEFRDLGGSVVGIDPITMKTITSYGKSMTPGERDSSARGWATVNQGAQRLALDERKLTQETAKDRAEARKVAEQERKDAMRRDMQSSRADIVIAAIDDATSQLGRTTTGALGAGLGMIPGTSAYDLRRTVDTIKANIGFQELQAMREASPTGGALGQVAVQELNMLQAVLASLDPNQGGDKVRANLGKARKHFENWKAAVDQARGVGVGGASGDWQAPGGGWSIQKVE